MKFGIIAAAALLMAGSAAAATNAQVAALFAGWRAFEASNVRDGVPDYRPATMAAKAAALRTWQARLATLDSSGWPIADRVDANLVRAEMNGLDYDLRVLRPWQRDPAFYVSLWTAQSDTPAHEGPIHHAPIELWQYSFPLDAAAEAKLATQLGTVAPLLQQARGNLTGNARDLWTSGIRIVGEQATGLDDLGRKTAGAGPDLRRAVAEASAATRAYLDWLNTQTRTKTGPSGVGIANYDWYLRNVQLSPLTWADELAILKRDLARSHAALRLEEHNHRKLPPIAGAADAAAFDARATAGVRQYLAFLRDNEILTVRDYMEPALMAKRGSFVAPAKQDFFTIVTHREPMALYTHFYHWFDLANMAADPHPSPVRRGALLSNIWVSRAEGFATANEEMMLHAGLFDGTPRGREFVWIMLAQRAARGIASLYAHANQIDLAAAQAMQVARTPNGMMSPDLPLLAFEQGLYLRTPGYGTSYITGKHQLEMLFAEAFEARPGFTVKRFYDELNTYGMIPVSMIRWQMLGVDDEARAIGALTPPVRSPARRR